jgi:hypothetical protein
MVGSPQIQFPWGLSAHRVRTWRAVYNRSIDLPSMRKRRNWNALQRTIRESVGPPESVLSEPHVRLPPKMQVRFPPEQLAFSWERSDQMTVREAELLAAYREEFGELPPLNAQG